MEIVVERLQCDEDVTIGSMVVDGDWQCWTLEDVVREQQGQPVSAWKIKGKTAIPAGRYRVDLTMSVRFKRVLPILLNVPGFDGIRIHAGNTADDTEGCILVGNERLAKSLARSQLALAPLLTKMTEAQRRSELIWIEIN